MEDTIPFQDVEDSEDALSFCDLPIHNFQPHDDHPKGPKPSCQDDDFLEFLPDPIGISGRTITFAEDPTTGLVGRRSEPLTPTAAAASRSRHVRRSYSSMKMMLRARWKKHACMFGLPKFPPEMELSDIRRRQSSRTPASLFSMENNGEVVSGSGKKQSEGYGGLLRSLMCGGHLRSSLGGAAFASIFLLV